MQQAAAATPAPVASPVALVAASNVPPPVSVAAPPAYAHKTESGMFFESLTPGTGKEHPRPQDEMTVSYVGWRKDGTMFDRSLQPVSLRLAQLFPGFAETLAAMTPGEKRRVWIPARLAYGDNPKSGQPAGDLTMDIELVELVRLGDEPEAPSDLKTPPASATRTPSGLVYKVLTEGTGRSPGLHDAVLVKYSGFTADGTAFDTTVRRGRATTVRVDQVVKGWAEGLTLMKEGETTEFWLPPELGYGDASGQSTRPRGPLVFVTELVKVKDSVAGR